MIMVSSTFWNHLIISANGGKWKVRAWWRCLKELQEYGVDEVHSRTCVRAVLVSSVCCETLCQFLLQLDLRCTDSNVCLACLYTWLRCVLIRAWLRCVLIQGDTEIRFFKTPQDLVFVLDSRLHLAIEEAKLLAQQAVKANISSFMFCVVQFNMFSAWSEPSRQL